MKDRYAIKFAYAGAGAGLVLFFIIGILFGSFLGGVMGLNVAGKLFGMPVEPGVLQRVIIALSMILGVMLSAMVSVFACASLGWVIGKVVDAARVKKAEEAEAKVKVK